jgi:hypothetical protein
MPRPDLRSKRCGDIGGALLQPSHQNVFRVGLQCAGRADNRHCPDNPIVMAEDRRRDCPDMRSAEIGFIIPPVLARQSDLALQRTGAPGRIARIVEAALMVSSSLSVCLPNAQINRALGENGSDTRVPSRTTTVVARPLSRLTALTA